MQVNEWKKRSLEIEQELYIRVYKMVILFHWSQYSLHELSGLNKNKAFE